MNVEEALDLIGEHKLLVHGKEVFFNTHDEVEAVAWDRVGARVVAWYPPKELAYHAKMGRSNPQGWEIHPLGAIEQVWEPDADGHEVNVTASKLAEAARSRVAA